MRHRRLSVRSLCALLALASLALAQDPAALPAPTPVPDPFWPITVKLPESLGGYPPPAPGKPVPADLRVWLPEGATTLRAVMLVPENSDSKHVAEHAPLRAAATKHGMGIVYMRGFKTGIEHLKDAPPPDGKNLLDMLDIVATETGVASFRDAPWIVFGKSSRGEFPFMAAWIFPERVIAGVTYHGQTPTWPIPDWSKAATHSILWLNANGETEWGGTWFNHVRPSLLNYRAHSAWLPHIAVAKDVGHGDYVDGHGSEGWGKSFPGKVSTLQVWDYIARFIDQALELRLPAEAGTALRVVSDDSGLALDPFAVEETFGVPHLPLKEADGSYLVEGGEEAPVSGFASFAPLPDFAPGEGVPVVAFVPGQSPRQWLITDPYRDAMKLDPLLDLGDYASLRPKVGDTTLIDETTVSFKPLAEKQVGPNGGISMAGLKNKANKSSLIAYTVLDVAEKQTVIVNAGYTAATRIQLVLNGQPIRHKQVLELAPGKYPLLVVLRMGANWGQIEPNLGSVGADKVDLAKQVQAVADAYAAELAKLKASDAPKKAVIRKADELPAEARTRMFWLPPALADAWLDLHTPAAK